MKTLVIGLILIAALGLVLYFAPKTQAPSTNTPNNSQITVTDFKTCVSAGYVITESDPAICTTPDGHQYTESTQAPDVVINEPFVAQVVTSPMTITGKVRGTWFSEANLPIELQDESGKVIAQMGYMTSDNWMTTDYVNVNTTLSFKAPSTDYGKLIIRKDNPSGDPARDQSFEVPVRFK
jgi:hypothetical protein